MWASPLILPANPIRKWSASLWSCNKASRQVTVCRSSSSGSILRSKFRVFSRTLTTWSLSVSVLSVSCGRFPRSSDSSFFRLWMLASVCSMILRICWAISVTIIFRMWEETIYRIFYVDRRNLRRSLNSISFGFVPRSSVAILFSVVTWWWIWCREVT